MKKWILALSIALFSVQSMAAAGSAIATAPDALAQQFYTWYLHALSEDQSPVDEHDPLLNRYVTMQLLNKITTLIKTPEGMDNDFFLQDQDYNDDWVDHVNTGKFTVNGTSASGEVVLGEEPAGQRHLLVTVHKEGRAWKIDDVEIAY